VFRNLESILKKRQEEFQAENQEKVSELNNQMFTQLNQYIKEYGDQHGYTYIFGTTSDGNIMYAKESEEITEKVRVFINKKYQGAEAAKVIENSQRDINIAFVNELSKIFSLMDINTQDVLDAAGTKWNFLPFKPGLVGGHCIGVDPYYLAQKAQELGYHPEIILAGRRLNDSMGSYVASEAVKLLIKNDLKVNHANILLLGITFKENCPDIRNTRIIDVYLELKSYGINVSVYDPWANSTEVKSEYGIDMISEIEGPYDEIIAAVNHKEFKNLDIKSLLVENGCLYDLKGVFDKSLASATL